MRISGRDEFTAYEVHDPNASLNGTETHRQWLVVEDGADQSTLSTATGFVISHSFRRGFSSTSLETPHIHR